MNIFYTAPTAIRSLESFGNEFVHKFKRDSLRILGTVGEPIGPQAWQFYYEVSLSPSRYHLIALFSSRRQPGCGEEIWAGVNRLRQDFLVETTSVMCLGKLTRGGFPFFNSDDTLVRA